MGAESSAPRTVTRPAGRQDLGTTYTRHCITSRDLARATGAWLRPEGPATDADRLDWLEVALRDGLGAERRLGRLLIGYADAAGEVDASQPEGSGPTLRAAIDDAIERGDAECAALDARAEVAS